MAIYEERLIDNGKSTEEKLMDVINVAKNAQIKTSKTPFTVWIKS